MNKMNIMMYHVVLMMILIGAIPSVYAKNMGVVGEVYLISEMDFLEFIQKKALSAEKSGDLKKLKLKMQQNAIQYRDRPIPVENILHTMENKSWLFDPTVIFDHDILSEDGRIIAKKGTHINPLSYVHLSKALVFYDSDDRDEREWVKKYDIKMSGKDKLILVKGSILKEENRLSKQIYFDQAGRLTTRFHITHVPAVVMQEGKLLRIREVKP